MITSLNIIIFTWLHGFAGVNGVGDFAIIAVASWLPFVIVPLILILEYKQHHALQLEDFLWILASGFFAFLVGQILKWIVGAPRPFIALPEMVPLFTTPDAYGSFPSLHATFFSAIGLAFFLKHHRAGVWFLLVALAIGLARVIVGVHFPVDIIFGYGLGAVVALAFFYLERYIGARAQQEEVK